MNMRLPLFAALLLGGGLQAAEEPSAPSVAVNAAFVEADTPALTELRDLGERAVDVCHLKALPLTGEIIAGMPRITGVKRTSLRLRNPANAPDPAEKQALARVEKDLANGILPKVLLQRVERPGSTPEWRVYRPVGVAPACVTCHGPRESLAPDLAARLAARYPDDQATGYAAGQWRGLIRVTVAEAPPPQPIGRAAPSGSTPTP